MIQFTVRNYFPRSECCRCSEDAQDKMWRGMSHHVTCNLAYNYQPSHNSEECDCRMLCHEGRAGDWDLLQLLDDLEGDQWGDSWVSDKINSPRCSRQCRIQDILLG